MTYENLTEKNLINIVIERFDGDNAILSLPDGQKLDIAKSKLPASVKEGDKLALKIQTDQDIEADRALLAKSLLNEIFKNS